VHPTFLVRKAAGSAPVLSGMHAVSAPAPTSSVIPTTEHVAVVAPDILMIQRIREALGTDAVSLGYSAARVESLDDDAAQAVAVVVAGGKGVAHCSDLVTAATRRFPGVPVILIASLSRIGVHRALEAGAAGLVLDSQVESSLAATIRAVRAGQLVAPRELRRAVTRPPLSHRERQTLALLVNGFTNRQIAAQLFLAESTVKSHLTSVFSKLGVGTRSEAVALALDSEEKLGLDMLGLSVPDDANASGAPNGVGPASRLGAGR
jgi:DNA-binding NarL/FixJ family response regulator